MAAETTSTRPRAIACGQRRTMLVRTFEGIAGYPYTMEQPVSVRWETRACAIPLFTEHDQTRGICGSCLVGFSAPHNFPADGPEKRCPGCQICAGAEGGR